MTIFSTSINTLKILFLFTIIIFTPPAFAWNAMGHRIIAAIAYSHLTPQAKKQSDLFITYMANAYPYNSTFQTASSWADSLKQEGVHAYDTWHFYNKPFSMDGTTLKPAQSPNIIWALNQSILTLKNPNINYYQKAFFMRFLLHLTGDAHQPLHCSNFFSHAYPNGDEGGNLYPSPAPGYANLHAYWDSGAGLFTQSSCHFIHSKSRQVICLANQIQADYPEKSFTLAQINNFNPTDWVNESFLIAQQHIYAKHNYSMHQDQIISEQQLALAGYRLAGILNSLFKNNKALS